jgi:flagellar biogenesis protein FliO
MGGSASSRRRQNTNPSNLKQNPNLAESDEASPQQSSDSMQTIILVIIAIILLVALIWFLSKHK